MQRNILFHKIVELFGNVENNDNDDNQSNGSKKRPQELLDDVPDYLMKLLCLIFCIWRSERLSP